MSSHEPQTLRDPHDLFRDAFIRVIQLPEHAGGLREAAEANLRSDWTAAITSAVVSGCEACSWQASAKGHKLSLLPVARSEYLSLDVVAFGEGNRRWRFPEAVFELENSAQLDVIAYSLWKVMLVRARLRAVFCYREKVSEGGSLVRRLSDEVLGALGMENWQGHDGETLVVVGSRGDAATFPYGFFQWWHLNHNLGRFEQF